MSTDVVRYGGQRLPRPVRQTVAAEEHRAIAAAARVSGIARVATLAHRRLTEVALTEAQMRELVPDGAADFFLAQITAAAAAATTGVLVRMAME